MGFEFYWDKDRKGQPRVKRRTAPKKLQGASRRIKAWIKKERHLSKRDFVNGLNRRLTGLDGHKTESVDILFELEMSSLNNARVKKVVAQVRNEAFDIELTENECSYAANAIIGILGKKH